MSLITPSFAFFDASGELTVYVNSPFSKKCVVHLRNNGRVLVFETEINFLKIKLPSQVQDEHNDNGTNNIIYDTNKQRYVLTFKKYIYDDKTVSVDVITPHLIVERYSEDLGEPIHLTDQLNNVADYMGLADKLHNTNFFEETPSVIFSNSDSKGKYGFANKYTKMFDKIEDDLMDVIRLPDPDSSAIEERNSLRETEEQRKFDMDHYIADFFLQPHEMESCSLSAIITFAPYKHLKDSCDISFDAEEMEILKGLVTESIDLCDENETNKMLLSLLDILLAYAYDFRCTLGEHNSESGWNINNLSSTLSWLQVFHSLDEVVIAFMRRSLCHPFFRNWRLSKCVLQDVISIFKLGRRQMLKCLLTIFKIFEEDDNRHILNTLYIRDFLIWIQQVDPIILETLADNFKQCLYIVKEDIGFNLNEIEQEAILILKQQHNMLKYVEWQRTLKRLILAIECKSESDSSESDSEYNSCDSGPDDESSVSNNSLPPCVNDKK